MELDDLIQVGRMHLWACCVKCDAERIDTFHAYVMKGMKWAMSDESMKGMPFKVSRKVSHEERNQIHIHSIDLHRDEEPVNECSFSYRCGREEALLSVEFEEVTSVLEEKRN